MEEENKVEYFEEPQDEEEISKVENKGVYTIETESDHNLNTSDKDKTTSDIERYDKFIKMLDRRLRIRPNIKRDYNKGESKIVTSLIGRNHRPILEWGSHFTAWDYQTGGCEREIIISRFLKDSFENLYLELRNKSNFVIIDSQLNEIKDTEDLEEIDEMELKLPHYNIMTDDYALPQIFVIKFYNINIPFRHVMTGNETRQLFIGRNPIFWKIMNSKYLNELVKTEVLRSQVRKILEEICELPNDKETAKRAVNEIDGHIQKLNLSVQELVNDNPKKQNILVMEKIVDGCIDRLKRQDDYIRNVKIKGNKPQKIIKEKKDNNSDLDPSESEGEEEKEDNKTKSIRLMRNRTIENNPIFQGRFNLDQRQINYLMKKVAQMESLEKADFDERMKDPSELVKTDDYKLNDKQLWIKRKYEGREIDYKTARLYLEQNFKDVEEIEKIEREARKIKLTKMLVDNKNKYEDRDSRNFSLNFNKYKRKKQKYKRKYKELKRSNRYDNQYQRLPLKLKEYKRFRNRQNFKGKSPIRTRAERNIVLVSDRDIFKGKTKGSPILLVKNRRNSNNNYKNSNYNNFSNRNPNRNFNNSNRGYNNYKNRNGGNFNNRRQNWNNFRRNNNNNGNDNNGNNRQNSNGNNRQPDNNNNE